MRPAGTGDVGEPALVRALQLRRRRPGARSRSRRARSVEPELLVVAMSSVVQLPAAARTTHGSAPAIMLIESQAEWVAATTQGRAVAALGIRRVWPVLLSCAVPAPDLARWLGQEVAAC